MSDKNEIDKVSGVETTGHEWDGLKELNNPAPRWWLWVFFVTVIWSVGYWILFPSWPTIGGATQGLWGWTSHKKLAADQGEIAEMQRINLGKFSNASLQDIMNDPELYAFAVAGGKAAFKDNCATCHGSGGAGSKGYPNLNDDDWLWGGTLDDIFYTIKHGIRSVGDDSRFSLMTAFGKDGVLKPDEIEAVTDYVLTLSGTTPKDSHVQGQQIFQQNCASCHGADGKGMRDTGAPNLTDKIWLYGGDRQTIRQTVTYARKGVMPAWKGRLDENTIKALTVYVHQLGGGEEDKPAQAPKADPQQEPAGHVGADE
ncbi:MAG TPA: cytochrome-c oxidase, cbb3-type subunit III [Rhodospirillaceae bacterium]|nr:cytochrome-c oxidase, cbb3-type subunit III [Rhodospirillaceae bacterium]